MQASRGSGVPLSLAVVPTGDMAALAERLARTPLVTVIQHGVDHQNRRSGPAAGEFAHDWTQHELEVALLRGWSLIQALPRARALFAPPWNDVHPALEAALGACGYQGWSANGALSSADAAVLPRLDAHLDLLRWRGGARFRGAGRFGQALTRELARRRKAGLWDAPIGLLTHHLVHDVRAWSFLEAFLAWTQRRPEFAWAALPDLIGQMRSGDGAETLQSSWAAELSLVG